MSVSGSLEAAPRFWGNSVEVEFTGMRTVRFANLDTPETYT